MLFDRLHEQARVREEPTIRGNACRLFCFLLSGGQRMRADKYEGVGLVLQA